MAIYFLIPVYNEALNIPKLSADLKGVLMGEEKFYLFVDDSSNDETILRINESFCGNAYHIIKKDKNLGPGDSFNQGFEWIIQQSKQGDNLVVTLEADNTSDLSILSNMVIIARLGYKLVLASVYAQGGGFDKTSLIRKTISFVANLLFRFFLNVHVLTISSFYRVYHVELVKRIKSQYGTIIEQKGFVSMAEILVKAIHVKASVLEVPMVLHSVNRKGKSKMKIIRTTMSYLRFLMSCRNNISDRHPTINSKTGREK